MASVHVQLPSGQSVFLTGNRGYDDPPIHIPRIGEQVVYGELTYEVDSVRTDITQSGTIQHVYVLLKRSD